MRVREPESLRTRTAAFLFWDTVGSTALLARLGDERAEEVRRRLLAVVREVVTANRGEEVKNTGDGLMVAFPSSLGDSLSCAIGIQRAVAVLDGQFPDVELAVRVGITAGDAVSDAAEGDWFGRAVTTAARLCDAAPANESFATAALAELTDWSVEPVGPLTLKGLPEPVDTVRVPWTLTDRTAIVALPPVLQLGEGLPLVGRRDQLARLDRSFERARKGEPVRVRITGPIGCGVTRLAREWLHGRGVGAELVLGASCVDREPFDAIAAAVDWHAASRPEDLMGPGMDGLAPLIAAVAPSVARRFGVAAAHAPRAEVQAALLSYVRGLTDAGPVVVVFDDCAERHHIAMDEIADALAGRPALIVSAGSADIADPGDIGVLPLTVDEIAELLHSALGLADGVDSATADLIAQESGGVALQVCEVVNALTRERADLSTAEAAHAAVTSAITLSCPYRGLKSMGTDDHALFFGRDGLLAELIGAVGRSRVTVVSGMSGSGKSSLLAAGLVPALQLGASNALDVRGPVVFTPGRDPDHSLDEVIASHLDTTALGGHSAQPGGGVVLIVDQLEEIWTHGLRDDERDRFVDRLVALGSQEERDVRVVLGLRSDFLGSAIQHDRLRSALRDSQVLVGTPDVDDLRRMILGPAETTGFALEDGLVERFLSDVAGETGALPLLSHALYETWRRRQGRMLTLAGYEACGAIEGAIAATADGVVGSMTADEVDETRHLFNRLVTLGEGQADTRRRARTEELTQASRRVAEPFVEARLLTAGEDTIEVSHEALLQHWPRLVGWLSEDRDDLRRLRHLADATAAWEAAGRNPADLYRGSRLETANEVADRRPAALNESERAFLDAGSAEATLVARRERRRRNLMRSAVVGLACLLVAAVVAGLLAVGQWRRAEDETETAREQRVDAERQAQRAEEAAASEQVERLMAESRIRQGSEIDLSILLALEGMRRKPGPETERVLFEAMTSAGPLSAARSLAAEPTRPAPSTVSPEGELWRATADGPVAVDMTSGERIGDPLTSRPGSRPVQVEPLDGGLLAVTYEDGFIQIVDEDTGAVHSGRNLTNRPVFLLASRDSRTLAVNAQDGKIRFLSVPDLGTVSEVEAQISGTWVAAAGGIVVSGGPLGTRLQKYDVGGLVWAEEFDASFSALGVDDSTDTTAAALTDGRVITWSGDDVSKARTLIELQESVGVLLAFGADGEELMVARNDGILLKLDLTGRSLMPAENLASIDERLSTMWVDEEANTVSLTSASRWYQFRLDGVGPLATRYHDGERADTLVAAGDVMLVGGQPGWIETKSVETGATIRTDQIGENAVIAALARLPGGVVVSTAEFRDFDPEQVAALQDVLGVPARSALVFPTIYALQESSLTLLKDSGEAGWQLPMDFPVIGLASRDDGRWIVAYDVSGSLSVIDPRSGSVVQTVPGANRFYGSFLTEGESDVFAVGGEISVRVMFENGRLEVADEDPLLGWVVEASSEDLFVSTRSAIRMLDRDTGDTRAEIATPTFARARVLSYRGALVVGAGSSVALVDQDLSRSSVIGTYPPPVDVEPTVDGGFLVLDGSGRVERWTMDPVEWQRIACDLIGRDLTSEEWSSFFSSEEYRPTCG